MAKSTEYKMCYCKPDEQFFLHKKPQLFSIKIFPVLFVLVIMLYQLLQCSIVYYMYIQCRQVGKQIKCACMCVRVRIILYIIKNVSLFYYIYIYMCVKSSFCSNIFIINILQLSKKVVSLQCQKGTNKDSSKKDKRHSTQAARLPKAV